MTAARARVLDSVELLRAIEGWPVGAVGVLVWEYPNSALVEMVTEDQLEDGLPERDLVDDLVSVPYDALRVIHASRAVG